MRIIQGFLTYAPLIDNTLDQVSTFGEISSNSLTYAKDKTYYTNEGTATSFISFHSVRDEEAVSVPTTTAELTVNVGQFIYSQGVGKQFSNDVAAFQTAVQNQFGDDISNFTSGNMLQDGDVWLPEWVKFTDLTLGEDNEVTVWLADDSFSRQYSYYYIEVLSPILPLDDFFKDPIDVKVALQSKDIVDRMDDVQIRRGQYPFTEVQGKQYTYHNAQDSEDTASTYWIVLIYGQAGNNYDLIKNAIVEYVLGNSTHSQEEWAEILPDLFTNTEFIITPLWTQYSVPNRELQAGIYSPTVRPTTALALTQQTVQGPKYSSAWIQTQYEISYLLYKSLGFTVVGNPDNRDGVVRFSNQFSDYFVVTNESADFNRMSVVTQEFVAKFQQLIKLAEEMTDTSDIPVGFSRLSRNGVVYATMIYQDITYLIVTKKTVEALTEE